MPPLHKKSTITVRKVHFFSQGIRFTLSNRNKLKTFIQSIFSNEGKKLQSINFIFCTDKALLKINRQYLNHDEFTDIITFDLSESEKTEAEIYISIDRVRENARKLKLSFNSEIHRVVFHGVLHLCGYSDKTKANKLKMREKEGFYINKYL